MFLISSILDKRLEKQCWTLQQYWTFTTLPHSRRQFCKWCKYRYGKKGKEKCPSTLLYRVVWLIFKSLFFGKLISSIVPIYENLKDPWKMFFPFSHFRSCSSHHLLSRRFLSQRKRKPSLSFQHYRRKN